MKLSSVLFLSQMNAVNPCFHCNAHCMLSELVLSRELNQINALQQIHAVSSPTPYFYNNTETLIS